MKLLIDGITEITDEQWEKIKPIITPEVKKWGPKTGFCYLKGVLFEHCMENQFVKIKTEVL